LITGNGNPAGVKSTKRAVRAGQHLEIKLFKWAEPGRKVNGPGRNGPNNLGMWTGLKGKGKVRVLAIALLTCELVTRSAL